MAKDKNIRKKTRFNRYQNWNSECESFSDANRRQFAEEQVEPPRNRWRRKKKNKPYSLWTRGWWFGKDYCLGRYERLEDATKAKKSFEKKHWYKDHTIYLRARVKVEENPRP